MGIWSKLQQTTAPTLNETKGMVVEMVFEYSGEDGSTCLDWYRGTIDEIVNKNQCLARIKWHAETLAKNDVRVTVQQLTPFHWNPKKIRKNEWREYITK